jgi:hypothetical protein
MVVRSRMARRGIKGRYIGDQDRPNTPRLGGTGTFRSDSANNLYVPSLHVPVRDAFVVVDFVKSVLSFELSHYSLPL